MYKEYKDQNCDMFASFITNKHRATPEAIKQTTDLRYGEITTEGFKRDNEVYNMYFKGLPKDRKYKNYAVEETLRSDFFVPTTRIHLPEEGDFFERRKPIFVPGLPRPEEIDYASQEYPMLTRSTGSYRKV
jgi:hypothetical protein